MKLEPRWEVAACLAALILASGLAGMLAGRRLERAAQERRDNPETWNESAMRSFERIVRPSPEQRRKLEACLDTAVQELKTIRSETIARSTNVIWRLVAQVEQELTPEQRVAFEAMKPKPGDLATLDVLQVERGKK